MPSQPLTRLTSGLDATRRVLACVLSLLCLGTSVSAQQYQTSPTPQSSPLPSWRRGQSAWTGSGYETLPPPARAASPANAATPTGGPASTPTLAPPLAAESQQLPAEWETDFGLSGQHSVMEELQLSDARSIDEEFSLVAPVLRGDGKYAEMEPDSLSDMQLGAALAEAAPLDEPPLQEDVLRWYQVPWRWVMKGWTSSAELGLNGSSGNSVTTAIQTGLDMKRKTDIYTLGIAFNYRQASTQGRNTENNGRLNIDYDRSLGDTDWTSFAKLGMESDKFKAFDLRLNMNSGLGYYWIRNDSTNFITRLGAGASREFGAPIDRWTPEALIGMNFDSQISARQKIIAKLDYFPSLRNYGDYRVVSELAWETLVDSVENLSVRLSVNDRYDSTPQGALPNDVYYAALMLYKF